MEEKLDVPDYLQKDSRWELVGMISKGAFGRVYKVNDQNNMGSVLAVKVESKIRDASDQQRPTEPMVAMEYNLYMNYLRNLQGQEVPTFVYYHEDAKHNYLFMEMLSYSMKDLFRHHRYCPGDKFPYATTISRMDFYPVLGLYAGILMLRILRKVHQCCVLHRDIKPENFMIRMGKQPSLVLIDFGLATVFCDRSTNEIAPLTPNNPSVGTLRYMPISMHKGYTQFQKDELESWFYTMIDMMYADLPWKSLGKEEHRYVIEQHKINFYGQALCTRIPKLSSVYLLLRISACNQDPNYEFIERTLVDVIRTVYKFQMSEVQALWEKELVRVYKAVCMDRKNTH